MSYSLSMTTAGLLLALLAVTAIPIWGEDLEQADVERLREILAELESTAVERRDEALPEQFEALRSRTVSASQRAVSPPYAYDLSIQGDVGLGGVVFKNGYPFLHTDGGPTAFNTALGRDALVSSTPGVPMSYSGKYNTATGHYALRYNTEGFSNTASGVSALVSNTTGYRNTATGTLALRLNTTGYHNTATGAFALRYNTTGSRNTANGDSALFDNTIGRRNTAVGANALLSNTSGSQNTALGTIALRNNTTSDGNTAIGYGALAGSTGSSNIALGKNAGALAYTGDFNIFIGNYGSPGDSGVIKIGYDHSSTFIDGIFGNIAVGGAQVFINSDNKLGTSNSSRRFKEDIQNMGEASAALADLRPVTFRYTEEAVAGGPRPVEFGLIAEEVAEIYPDLVVYGENGEPYSVRYHVLAPMLLNEVQRLREESEQQRQRIALLEARDPDLAGLRRRLERLESMSTAYLRTESVRDQPAAPWR